MSVKYKHLNYNSRLLLKQMLDSGASLKAISVELGVSVSTIYREISRNSCPTGYDPQMAQQSYNKKMKEKGAPAKLELNRELAYYISKLFLEELLSPAQVIERIRKENHLDTLSRNTLFSAIDNGLIPYVTRETLRHKKTHMFSNGLIKIPAWICEELHLSDNDELSIDVSDDTIIIKKYS